MLRPHPYLAQNLQQRAQAALKPQSSGSRGCLMSRRVEAVGVAFALVLSPAMLSPAAAQSNLDAGKSPAQIFSDTCNACHRNPREIKPASAAFLREHYTTGPR